MRDLPEFFCSGVAAVSLGYYHSIAVMNDGKLCTWGCNIWGNLGDGTTEDHYRPTEITIPSAMNDAKVFCAAEDKLLQADATETTPKALSEKATEKVNALTSVKTAVYHDLHANTIYNYYVMKDRNAKDPLSSDNLLYIGQSVTDSKGNFSLSYGAKSNYTGVDCFVIGVSVYDLGNAKVKIGSCL